MDDFSLSILSVALFSYTLSKIASFAQAQSEKKSKKIAAEKRSLYIMAISGDDEAATSWDSLSKNR